MFPSLQRNVTCGHGNQPAATAAGWLADRPLAPDALRCVCVALWLRLRSKSVRGLLWWGVFSSLYHPCDSRSFVRSNPAERESVCAAISRFAAPIIGLKWSYNSIWNDGGARRRFNFFEIRSVADGPIGLGPGRGDFHLCLARLPTEDFQFWLIDMFIRVRPQNHMGKLWCSWETAIIRLATQ